MPAKTQYLQVRVTDEQKSQLRRLAKSAGQDISAFVLARCLPPARIRFRELLEILRLEEERSFALAEINDLLAGLTGSAFVEAVADADLQSQSELTANYVAAMVEHAASQKHVPPPAWTRRVEPLELPYFVTPMKSLRPWLLAASPVAFRRRNIFIDSTVGDRV